MCHSQPSMAHIELKVLWHIQKKITTSIWTHLIHLFLVGDRGASWATKTQKKKAHLSFIGSAYLGSILFTIKKQTHPHWTGRKRSPLSWARCRNRLPAHPAHGRCPQEKRWSFQAEPGSAWMISAADALFKLRTHGRPCPSRRHSASRQLSSFLFSP